MNEIPVSKALPGVRLGPREALYTTERYQPPDPLYTRRQPDPPKPNGASRPQVLAPAPDDLSQQRVETPMTFTPKPYVDRDPRTIPPRQFLYGRRYIRGFLGATVAPGGVGKSSLALVEAVAMASGRNLLGIEPPKSLKVWYVNLEDPREEIERRVAAICLHFRIGPKEIEGWLFYDGRETEIILASQSKSGAIVATPVAAGLTAGLKGFDVLILDPFVSAHRVSENDNMAIDAVVKTLGRIAGEASIAIELLHHVRKTNGAEITAEDGRGASALIAAARSVRVLNPMTKEEGDTANVGENRRFYFRAAIGKANLAPPRRKRLGSSSKMSPSATGAAGQSMIKTTSASQRPGNGRTPLPASLSPICAPFKPASPMGAGGRTRRRQIG